MDTFVSEVTESEANTCSLFSSVRLVPLREAVMEELDADMNCSVPMPLSPLLLALLLHGGVLFGKQNRKVFMKSQRFWI